MAPVASGAPARSRMPSPSKSPRAGPYNRPAVGVACQGLESERARATVLLACPCLAGDPGGARVPARTAMIAGSAEIVATDRVASSAGGESVRTFAVDWHRGSPGASRGGPASCVGTAASPASTPAPGPPAAASGSRGASGSRPHAGPSAISASTRATSRAKVDSHWHVFSQVLVCPSAPATTTSGR